MQLRWFDVEGGAVPWIDMGPADAPIVVTLPGLSDGLQPLSEPSGHALMAEAADADLPLRIISLSHRHPLPDDVTTTQLARDVASFIDGVLEGQAVAVSGHSMGGMVAQHLAVERPDLVSHLVLTATLAAPVPELRWVLQRWDGWVAQGNWAAFYADADTTAFTGSELLRRRLVPQELLSPPSAELAKRHHLLTAAALSHDSTGVLSSLQAPTLVLAGSLDPVVPIAASRGLAAAMRSSTFVEMPGLAHGFPEQAPYACFDHISQLLRIPMEVTA